MISRMALKNFTVFAHAEFEFVPGLNVLIGENGTGKSHVLKVAYSVASVMGRGAKEPKSPAPYFEYVYYEIFKKLRGVFGFHEVSELVRHKAKSKQADVTIQFDPHEDKIAFSIKTMNQLIIQPDKLPLFWLDKQPIFLPARELLSIYPGFVSLYDRMNLPFEETWRDACSLLGVPSLKPAELKPFQRLIQSLEDVVGGPLVLDDNEFLLMEKNGPVGAAMMGEGYRKLGMISHLISNGTLEPGCTLFWDEPEANLNYKIVKHIARTIFELCKLGVQIIVSTHSVFLLRELYILHRDPEFSRISTHFIGLSPGKAGVKVEQGTTQEDIGDLTAVVEELKQSDRYLEVEFSHARPH